MQVNVEDVSTVKKVLHIEIPEDDVTREIDEAYKNLKKTVKLKGFRQGKAPRSVLEGLYKKQVHSDVSAKLIQESFEDAIRETDIRILGAPNIEPPELQEKQPYKYDAEIEINPEIGQIDFKGMELKKTIYKISEEEVDTQVEMLRKRMATQQKIEEDRPVQDGDFVLIDYEGFKDGKPFEEIQKTENYTVKIGDPQVLKEFNENLTGMKPGETKEISITFPEDYGDEKFANQNITFQVTLKEIRKEILPDIDDAFLKSLGQYETLDDLKNEIRKNLRQGYEKRSEQELSEAIFSAILEKHDFEVPELLVEYELAFIVADAEQKFSYHNTSLEELGLTKEIMSEKYRDTAINQVKRHLILGKIIDQEKLELSDEELEQGFKEITENSAYPMEDIKSYYQKNPDKLENFKHTLLEKRAVSLIIENGVVEEVETDTREPEKTEQN